MRDAQQLSRTPRGCPSPGEEQGCGTEPGSPASHPQLPEPKSSSAARMSPTVQIKAQWCQSKPMSSSFLFFNTAPYTPVETDVGLGCPASGEGDSWARGAVPGCDFGAGLPRALARHQRPHLCCDGEGPGGPATPGRVPAATARDRQRLRAVTAQSVASENSPLGMAIPRSAIPFGCRARRKASWRGR